MRRRLSHIPKIEQVDRYKTKEGIDVVVDREMGPMVNARDLVKFLLTMVQRGTSDPVKQAALQRFATDVVGMEPAVAHRRAVALLSELGGQIPPELESFPLTVATDDAKGEG